MIHSFEDWYFEDKFTPVGKWQANFHSISDVEADSRNIYGMRDDGTWARFQSDGGVEQHRLAAFRGYFEFDAPAGARNRAAALPGTYKTLFQMVEQEGTSAGENIDYNNTGYEGDIPYTDGAPTAIQPTIVAIDADGNCRYFDLQGRLLDNKPGKGLYIKNGKKIANP